MDFAYIDPEDLSTATTATNTTTIAPPVPVPAPPVPQIVKEEGGNGFFSNFFTYVVISLIGAILLVVLLLATSSPLMQPSVAGLNPVLTRIVLGSSRDPHTDRIFEIFLITFVCCLAICMVVG